MLPPILGDELFLKENCSGWCPTVLAIKASVFPSEAVSHREQTPTTEEELHWNAQRSNGILPLWWPPEMILKHNLCLRLSGGSLKWNSTVPALCYQPPLLLPPHFWINTHKSNITSKFKYTSSTLCYCHSGLAISEAKLFTMLSAEKEIQTLFSCKYSNSHGDL